MTVTAAPVTAKGIATTPTTAVTPAPAVAAASPAPVTSPALQWLQSLQAQPVPAPPASSPLNPALLAPAFGSPEGQTVPEEDVEALPVDHELDDLFEADASEETGSDGEDGPVSPDSTGVFSTVADALRAWTIEPAGEPAPPSPSPAVLSAAAAAEAAPVDPSRPAPTPSQYDLVRKSPRYELSSRRISVLVDDVPGDLVDLSDHGAQVVTSGMLKPSSHVRVAFPSGGPLATAKAKVAWSRLEPPTHGGGELQYRAGLSFTKIDPKTIERVLKAPDSAAAAPPRRGR